MAKSYPEHSKRTIKVPITDTIKQLRLAKIDNPDKVEELQAIVDYFNYGIRNNNLVTRKCL